MKMYKYLFCGLMFALVLSTYAMMSVASSRTVHRVSNVCDRNCTQILLFSLDSTEKKDTLRRPRSVGLFSPRSLLVQFFAGEVSYAIPFWSLSYPRLQKDRGQFSNAPDP